MLAQFIFSARRFMSTDIFLASIISGITLIITKTNFHMSLLFFFLKYLDYSEACTMEVHGNDT